MAGRLRRLSLAMGFSVAAGLLAGPAAAATTARTSADPVDTGIALSVNAPVLRPGQPLVVTAALPAGIADGELALYVVSAGDPNSAPAPSGYIEIEHGHATWYQTRSLPVGTYVIEAAVNVPPYSQTSYNVPQVTVTVAGTPWPMERHLIAAQGTDHQLWVRDTSTAGAWHSLGGYLQDAPSVVLAGTRNLFFARGKDGNVWVRSPNTAWSMFNPAGKGCAQPTASVAGTALYVTCIGSNSTLWYARTTIPASANPRITGWTSLGGNVRSGGSVWVDGSTVHVAAVGHAGGLYKRTLTTPWQIWDNCAAASAIAYVQAHYLATACRDMSKGDLRVSFAPYPGSSANSAGGGDFGPQIVGEVGLVPETYGVPSYFSVSTYVQTVNGQVWQYNWPYGEIPKGRGLGGHAVGGVSAAPLPPT